MKRSLRVNGLVPALRCIFLLRREVADPFRRARPHVREHIAVSPKRQAYAACPFGNKGCDRTLVDLEHILALSRPLLTGGWKHGSKHLMTYVSYVMLMLFPCNPNRIGHGSSLSPVLAVDRLTMTGGAGLCLGTEAEKFLLYPAEQDGVSQTCDRSRRAWIVCRCGFLRQGSDFVWILYGAGRRMLSARAETSIV